MATDRMKGRNIIAFPRDYVVVDTETTGLNPATDRITELSAVRYHDGKPVTQFTTLVNPGVRIPKDIEGLTHITNEMVKDAPKMGDVIGHFRNFVGDSTVVGYNVNFDINFIYDAMQRHLGQPFQNDFVDVRRIAKKQIDIPSYKQTDVAEHFGIKAEGAHRAINDVYICGACYESLKQDIIKSGKTLQQFASMFDDQLQGQMSIFDMQSQKSRGWSIQDGRVYISSGEFDGRSFKASYGTYTFTGEDIDALCAGRTIEIKDFVTRGGKQMDLQGDLGMCTNNHGKSYFGFNAQWQMEKGTEIELRQSEGSDLQKE